MSKYNREFLVTYLQDICALYIARSKIYNKVCEMDSMIDQLNVKKQYMKPEEPIKKDLAENKAWGYGLFGLGAFGGAVLMFCVGSATTLPAFFALCGMFCVCSGIMFLCKMVNDKIETDAYNERIVEEYRNDYDQYIQDMELYEKLTAQSEIEYTKNRAKRRRLLDERNQLAKEHQTMGVMINNAYGVNIIPNQYRDMYAAVYLYDYFSGSRETDIGLALNTYVLEQIKDRLDQVIWQLSEVILNQYEIIDNQHTMISNQKEAMDIQKRHHREMCEKLDRLILTDEERNTYLDMIDSHVSAVGYFAAADYIKRI